MKILVLNAGSSSQKCSLYEVAEDNPPDQPLPPLWEAQVDWTHQEGTAELQVKTAHGAVLDLEMPSASRGAIMGRLLATLWDGETQVIAEPDAIDVVGHRVVHGGQEYRQSVLVTPEVKAAIARLAALAPAHNPANLEGIEAIEQALGTVPQVAVFDTAFHSRMSEAAALYPGPYEWAENGIRRYGFHGISHQYCAGRAAHLLGRDLKSLRLINCHLGNGCSLAAIREGISIDTTMGFTPLDGLMMGSRSGAVDPGILIYLMREGYTADKLDHLLNRASGLLGVSGVSNDLRQIQSAIKAGNQRAQLALDLYVHRLRSEIGSMLASLGGLDALIFTAGVGEHSPEVRAAACEAFGFLGLKLDLQKNAHPAGDQDISTPDSTVRILVVHTQEDWAIAGECRQLLRAK